MPRPWRATPYVLPALCVYGLFVLWPLFQLVWLSTQQWNGYGPQRFVGLSNLQTLQGDAVFRTSLLHSTLWTLAAAVIPTLLAFSLAVLTYRLRRQAVFLSVFFFPALLPATAVAAIWLLVYAPSFGPIDTLLRQTHLSRLDWLGDPHLALSALFIAWFWSVVGIDLLVIRSGLLSIGREFLDLARIEGAGAGWRLRNVLFPASRNYLMVAIIVNVALSAQIFDLVFVTKGGGPGYATMILPLEIYGRAFGSQTGTGAAASLAGVLLGLLVVAGAFVVVRRTPEGFAGDDIATPKGTDVPAALGVRAGITVATLVFLLPLAWLGRAAIQGGRSFALGNTALLDPQQWTAANFGTAWGAGMSSAVGNSLLTAMMVVTLCLVLALPLAFGLAHLVYSRVARRAILSLLIAGLLTPSIAAVIPLFALLHTFGLLDSVWGIVLPETARALPFAVLVMWAYMSTQGRIFTEASAIDGASVLQQAVRVAIPLAWPAVFIAAAWTFVSSWNEYLLPTLVSQDGSLQTVPTVLSTFIGSYNTQYGSLAAGTLMTITPSLVLLLLLRGSAGPLTRVAKRLGR